MVYKNLVIKNMQVNKNLLSVKIEVGLVNWRMNCRYIEYRELRINVYFVFSL